LMMQAEGGRWCIVVLVFVLIVNGASYAQNGAQACQLVRVMVPIIGRKARLCLQHHNAEEQLRTRLQLSSERYPSLRLEHGATRVAGTLQHGATRVAGILQLQDLQPNARLVVLPVSHQALSLKVASPHQWHLIAGSLSRGSEALGRLVLSNHTQTTLQIAEEEFSAALRISPRLPEAVDGWRAADRLLCLSQNLERLAVRRQEVYGSLIETFKARLRQPVEGLVSSVQRIPRIIHQVWHAWTSDEIPPHLATLQRSWQERHPSWGYRLWRDADSRRLIARHYPSFLGTYDSYPEKVQKVDAVRYFILHRYGGFYVDMDSESVASLDPLLSRLEGSATRLALLGLSPLSHSAAFCRPWMLEMSFMASQVGHPLWPHIHRSLAEQAHLPVLHSTGPLLLSDALAKVPSDVKDVVTILPPEVAYPLDQWQTFSHSRGVCGQHDKILLQQRRTGYTVAVEHWCGSWLQYELG